MSSLEVRTLTYSYEFLSDRTVDSVLANLKKYGIALVPNFLSRERVEKLNEDLKKSIYEKTESVPIREDHPMNEDGKTARLNPWHPAAAREFPATVTTFQDPFLREIAEAFYAPHPIKLNEEIFFTNEFPSPKPILPWHFDRMQSLKFWFYLTDTTKENGAFEFCPGTHWEGHYRASYHLASGCPVEQLPNDIESELIRNPVAVETNAGDLLIFNPDGFHRGGIVQNGHERRVVRSHTMPLASRRYGDSPYSAGWWLSSKLNINRWLGRANTRILGDRILDHSVNRNENRAL